eukprot:3347768-Amphidinium_carterae.1
MINNLTERQAGEYKLVWEETEHFQPIRANITPIWGAGVYFSAYLPTHQETLFGTFGQSALACHDMPPFFTSSSLGWTLETRVLTHPSRCTSNLCILEGALPSHPVTERASSAEWPPVTSVKSLRLPEDVSTLYPLRCWTSIERTRNCA